MWQHHHKPLPSLLLALLAIASQLLSSLAAPQQQLPPGTEIQEDGPGQATINGDEVQPDGPGQVTINGDPLDDTSPPIPNLPIRATIFSGVPGPRACRGHVLLAFEIPPPPAVSSDRETNPEERITPSLCYNMPSPVGCGVFTANKQDGCEVNFFAEPNCRLYMNTAVFLPEERAVGGMWRSMSVRCGVPAPDPDTLGAPPLQAMMKQQGMEVGVPVVG